MRLFPSLFFLVPATVLHAQLLTQTQKLTAGDGTFFDEFGGSIAISGDTAVIGTELDDAPELDSGSAYVFTRANGTWTEQQRLVASDGANSDFFGKHVAIDGDTIVVGAEADDDDGLSSGAVYVFTRSNDVWSEQQKLTASDAAGGAWFGSAVAVEGDTLVVGAERDGGNGNNAGAAYVFTRSGSVWTEQQKLLAGNGSDFDWFGGALALDGDTVVIGAVFGDIGNVLAEQDHGTAYVFTRSGNTWTEQQMLSASDSAVDSHFGAAVALDGGTIVVGAPEDADNGESSGSAYVFSGSGSSWTQETKLLPSDGEADEQFGIPVDVQNGIAIVGARDDIGGGTGAAYVFTDDGGGSWSQQPAIVPADAANFDEFGFDVAIDGNAAMIGAVRDDDAGSASGSVYAYAVDVGTFSDIPNGFWARDFIETLAASGITGGCGNGNYCPDDFVTRAQMAVFLERGINGSGYTPPAASGAIFLDVAASDFAASFIEQLFLDGITAGCGGNNYCPGDSVTRAQMAVFLVRTFGL